MALKEAHGGAPWLPGKPAVCGRRTRKRWPERASCIRSKSSARCTASSCSSASGKALREHAHKHGIQIIGDIPIFVAHDSADVWATRSLFYLDKAAVRPWSPGCRRITSPPPDSFGATPCTVGTMQKENGYQWWLARLKRVLQLVDIIRVDHFRGFAGYWEMAAGMPTAEKGRWVQDPAQISSTRSRKGWATCR